MCAPESSPDPSGLQTEMLQSTTTTLEVAKNTATFMVQLLLKVDGPHMPFALSNRVTHEHDSSSSAAATYESRTVRNDVNENCHYRQQARWDITATVILTPYSTTYPLHLPEALWHKLHLTLQAELALHSSF